MLVAIAIATVFFLSCIIEEAHQLVNRTGSVLTRTTHGFTAWHGGYGIRLLRKVDLARWLWKTIIEGS